MIEPGPTIAEIIPGRLYWMSDYKKPTAIKNAFTFSIDEQLVYAPYFSDFGPLNLAQTWRYCHELEKIIKDPQYKKNVIFHYTTTDSAKRANAGFLMGAFQMIVLNKTAEEALKPFNCIQPALRNFRDASYSECSYDMTHLDLLNGLEYAIKLGWFNYKKFNVKDYEFYELENHGNLHWIVPGKFIALTTPMDIPKISPVDYVPIFKKLRVTAVVRLNTPCYDKNGFTERGVNHYEVFFKDGSTPHEQKVKEFIEVSEKESALAVHCKAGLGRTGTMITLYVMKHYKFPAAAFIGWIRLCRPGSVIGPQQHWLNWQQDECFSLESDIWDGLSEEVKECARRIAKYKKENLVMNDFETKVYKSGEAGQADNLRLRSSMK